MNKVFLFVSGFVLFTLLNACNVNEPVAPRTTTPNKLLLFTKTEGARHASLPDAIAAIRKIDQNQPSFTVTATESSSAFTSQNLQSYGAVLFLNTSGNVLNETQQAALKEFVQDGGGFMGVHSAIDTELNWPWYGQMIGARPKNHPPVQEAKQYVLQNSHPATQYLPGIWTRTDVWYNFTDIQDDIIPLINLDESSYTGGENGKQHPIAWYHIFEGGRVFYTGGGHTSASYHESLFTRHLEGGIKYVLNI